MNTRNVKAIKNTNLQMKTFKKGYTRQDFHHYSELESKSFKVL